MRFTFERNGDLRQDALANSGSRGTRGSSLVRHVLLRRTRFETHNAKEMLVNRIVYIVGAIVIIVALLSCFGFR